MMEARVSVVRTILPGQVTGQIEGEIIGTNRAGDIVHEMVAENGDLFDILNSAMQRTLKLIHEHALQWQVVMCHPGMGHVSAVARDYQGGFVAAYLNLWRVVGE